MSSTSISSALSSSSPPQSSSSSGTDSGSSNGGAQPHKTGFNNLTFVIIFFVLLVVFVAVGTISRRRFMARRGPGFEFDLTMDDDELTPEEVEQARPVLYEMSSANAITQGWNYQKPLSAALVKSTHWTSTKAAIEDDTISTTPGPRNPSRSQSSTADDSRPFPSFSVSSWRRGHNSSTQPRHSSFFDEELSPIETPETLEVSVVIVMPSQDRSSHAGPSHDHGETGSGEGMDSTHSHHEPPSGSVIPEYQIGTMGVPWHTELRRETMPS